ncbi:MAG: hypothetical protein HQM10_04855 [Candidatus Riflebacteria bacterium]|nr:hypothetical protein [Candidatus Riflebacteria bacterium]
MISSNCQESRSIVVSNPRSGFHWLRYCLEFFSGRPTPGKPLIHDNGEMIISRTHDVRGNTCKGSPDCWRPLLDSKGFPLFKKMVLLLRDFRECCLDESNTEIDLLEVYAGNLRAYDKFSGEKILIYYENMVKNFSEVSRVLDFLGISHNPGEFDLEFHRRKSIMVYHRRRFSYTRNDLFNFHFHSDKASPEAVANIESRITSLLEKELREKYLSCYLKEV